MEMGRIGNDQGLSQATLSYLTAVWSYGLEGLCIPHTKESHSHGKRDDRRESSAEPFRVCLGLLHDGS